MAVITSTITNNCDATVTAAIQLPSWPPDSWEPACKAALVACGFRREGTQSYYYRNSNHPAVVAAIETGLLQLGICFRTSDWGVDAIKEYLAPVADAVEAELIRVTLYLRATQDTLDIEKIRSRLAGAEYLRDVLASNENDFKALEEDTVYGSLAALDRKIEDMASLLEMMSRELKAIRSRSLWARIWNR